SISAWIWAAQQSDLNQWPVIAAINTSPPVVNDALQEIDFTIIGFTEEKAGWSEYSLEIIDFKLANPLDAQIYVSFGISVTWETNRTYWVDYMTIKVDSKIYEVPTTNRPFPGILLVGSGIALALFVAIRKRMRRFN
ncbi:MAG: hypothetical protein ACFFE8_16535, partial [Candidatus Heimdallarchaeota archaeon]